MYNVDVEWFNVISTKFGSFTTVSIQSAFEIERCLAICKIISNGGSIMI